MSLPWERIKMIRHDNPSTPSQTLKVKKINNIYKSLITNDNKNEKQQNNLKMINSNLNKLIMICLWFQHKEIKPLINMII